jgi:hypothetical protein
MRSRFFPSCIKEITCVTAAWVEVQSSGSVCGKDATAQPPSGRVRSTIPSASLCNAISKLGDRSGVPRTIGATEKSSSHLDTMPDDFALAMLANRRHPVDRAFEAVKCVPCTRSLNNKSFIVFVPAGFAFCHRNASILTNCSMPELSGPSELDDLSYESDEGFSVARSAGASRSQISRPRTLFSTRDLSWKRQSTIL